MLAHPGNLSILYRVKIEGTIELSPLWQNDGKGFDRILGVFSSQNSQPVIAIAGDSGIVGVNVDGTLRYHHKGLIRSTLSSMNNRAHYHLVESYGDRSFFETIDLTDGSIISKKEVNGSGEVFLVRSTSPGTMNTLLLGLSSPPTYYRIREKSNGFQAQQSIPRFPQGAIGLSTTNSFALFYNSLSLQLRFYGLMMNSPFLHSYYPLSTPFQSVAANKDLVVLVGHDSAVLYDSDLDYLCTTPAIGGKRLRLLSVDTLKNQYLLVTENGSVQIEVKPDPWRWIYPCAKRTCDRTWITSALASWILHLSTIPFDASHVHEPCARGRSNWACHYRT